MSCAARPAIPNHHLIGPPQVLHRKFDNVHQAAEREEKDDHEPENEMKLHERREKGHRAEIGMQPNQ
jgi:hypothetical protein